jgi:hypothetical protein
LKILISIAAALGLALGMGADSVPSGATTLDLGYRAMYNLDFTGAHHDFKEWRQKHPDDAMGPVSDAAADLFSEFDRLHVLQSEFFIQDQSFFRHQQFLHPDPVVKREFESALGDGQRIADRVLAQSPENENALLASVLGMGLQADYLALIEKRNLAALSEMKQSRSLAERLLARYPHCYDAYLAVGVENYLLSLKPAPVRWMLHLGGAETDKQTGIERLRITAEKGHYLLPYARLLLAVAALRDNDVATARRLLTWLSTEFPGNPLYRAELHKLK